MGANTSILICLTIFSSIYFSLAQDENQFIYNGFNGSNLQLDGIAKIHSNGLLQLTNTSQMLKGHAFYKIPMRFNTASPDLVPFPSFSTNFVFAIRMNETSNISGQGLAFTISPSTDFSQAVSSQYLGLFNISNNGRPTNHVLAIELDTIKNPEFDDINNNHVGVDVNSLTSNDSAPAAYFSKEEGKDINLTLWSGDPMQVWVEYDAAKKRLNSTIAPIWSSKPDRPLLSTPIDLSQILLENMYVGFASATGPAASDHYVLGWSFNRTGPAQNLEISKLPLLPPKKKKSKKTSNIVIVLPIVGAFVLITFAAAFYIVKKKKYEEVHEEWEAEYGPQRISYKKLYAATKGFKEKGLLGAGGFGKVFRGTLPTSNLQIAVKRVSHDSKQGMKEFVAEVATMGRLRHRNLVQLLGYCRRKGELLLVYEYMPKGSLDKLLFGRTNQSLGWFHRFRVLKDVASALLYLHEEWEQIVLHRDVKSSNVLLDADFNGRLGDFGLSRLYDHGTNPKTTHVVGTVGYLAPELSRTGRATTATDVFAFGVFMFEVACGRRPTDLHGLPEEESLVDWVRNCWSREAILDVIDPRLEGKYLIEEMKLVLKVGLLCTQPLPAMRPNMRQVVQYLNGNDNLPEIQADSSVFTSPFSPSSQAYNLVLSFSSSYGKRSSYSTTSSESILHKSRH